METGYDSWMDSVSNWMGKGDVVAHHSAVEVIGELEKACTFRAFDQG
jgi:hypothetical protein